MGDRDERASPTRRSIAEHLALLASLDAQVQYQRAVPMADVPAELVCGWFDDLFVPDPKAAPLLAYLRAAGYRLALVSNFDHPPLLRARLTACRLASAFDAIVVSAEIGARKPDPAAFRPALRETGLAPHQVVHVGDSADDVLGALAAGIRPVHLHRDGAPDILVAGEVHRIAGLEELAGLLPNRRSHRADRSRYAVWARRA